MRYRVKGFAEVKKDYVSFERELMDLAQSLIAEIS